MGRRTLQNDGSSPSPTLQPFRVSAARPSDLDVRQRPRRYNDIVQVESRRVVTVMKDDDDTIDDDDDDNDYDRLPYDGCRPPVGHEFATNAVDRTDGDRLNDTLFEIKRLLSNGKLPQRFLEKLISDEDITDRLLTEFEKLTATPAAAAAAPNNPSPPQLTSGRRPPIAAPPAAAPQSQPQQQPQPQHQHHRGTASSSSSTPEMTAAGRRSVRFDGTASSSAADQPSTSGRTRRRRRDSRNNQNRSRSRSGGGGGGNRNRTLATVGHDDIGRDRRGNFRDSDSAVAVAAPAEHGCCSTCSSSSDSELDDLSVYRLPSRRHYGPGASGSAARISYVPNDAIAYYAKQQQQAVHRSPRGRTRAAAAANTASPPPHAQTSTQQPPMDDKNCVIQ